MAFFLFSDVGETRREGQIWFLLSHVVTWEAISSHANNIWGLWEVSIICFSANCCSQLIVCTLINNLVYVSSKRFSNCFDVVHVSEPYRSMFSTQVLNKFNFVLVEKPEVIMVWSLLQATQACAFLISKPFFVFDIYVPRYLKSLTCFNIFSI